MLSIAKKAPSYRQLAVVGRLGRRRKYNIGTESFHAAFVDLPKVDREGIRNQALNYLHKFDQKTWYDDPICTIINGEEHRMGKQVETRDAFDSGNGMQILATSSVLSSVSHHLKTFVPEEIDNRFKVRAIEKELFGPLAGELVGNQAFDFKKQDGVTEIEEAIEAGCIEQRLNDLLLRDESEGLLSINRTPAFVGCVSNFSNFLDLSRKVLRNIELGVPVVVLSRSNTTQHMFRWSQLLVDQMKKHGLELGLVTYVSCSLQDQQELFKIFEDSPMYFTGSRQVAQALKSQLRNTLSSTGGPNTLISTTFDDQVKDAIRTSALIENSGQCTALRHAVLPNVDLDQVSSTFDSCVLLQDPTEALTHSEFKGLLMDQTFRLSEGYTKHSKHNVEYKLKDHLPIEIEENWRKASVDVTSVGLEEMKSECFTSSLVDWLIEHQPISLAINGDQHPWHFARRLFEQSGLVVYTVGTEFSPALTAQARPQDGEIFGEVPPRSQVDWFTKFPTIVPSPTAGYNSVYTEEALLAQKDNAKDVLLQEGSPFSHLEPLLQNLDAKSLGYAYLLLSYLSEACLDSPRMGFGNRTSLYGLQRPPLNGSMNVIRLDANSSSADPNSVILHALPFIATNARNQLVISSDGSHPKELEDFVPVQRDSEPAFADFVRSTKPYNVISPVTLHEHSLVSHFVSKLMAVGHIKSTMPDHKEFVDAFKVSDKWLRIVSSD